MEHCEIFPTRCKGTIVLDEVRSTELVTVARCDLCAAEFQWEPDSESVTMVSEHAIWN